jgi:4-aminobutyrate aminotransferase
VTCLGHAHPAITAAVTSQLSKISHSQVNIFHSLAQVTLIDRLLPHMPTGLDTFFFANSGAEAVENAVKVSKAFNGRRGVVVMQGGYHGRTYGSSAMTSEQRTRGARRGGSDRRVTLIPRSPLIPTLIPRSPRSPASKTVYSAGFGTSLPGIYPTPFPYASQLHLPPSTPSTHLTDLSLSALSLLFKQQIPAHEVSCIVLEPVLGEGGYVPAPDGWLKALREVCDKEGILLGESGGRRRLRRRRRRRRTGG